VKFVVVLVAVMIGLMVLARLLHGPDKPPPKPIRLSTGAPLSWDAQAGKIYAARHKVENAELSDKLEAEISRLYDLLDETAAAYGRNDARVKVVAREIARREGERQKLGPREPTPDEEMADPFGAERRARPRFERGVPGGLAPPEGPARKEG